MWAGEGDGLTSVNIGDASCVSTGGDLSRLLYLLLETIGLDKVLDAV